MEEEFDIFAPMTFENAMFDSFIEMDSGDLPLAMDDVDMWSGYSSLFQPTEGQSLRESTKEALDVAMEEAPAVDVPVENFANDTLESIPSWVDDLFPSTPVESTEEERDSSDATPEIPQRAKSGEQLVRLLESLSTPIQQIKRKIILPVASELARAQGMKTSSPSTINLVQLKRLSLSENPEVTRIINVDDVWFHALMSVVVDPHYQTNYSLQAISEWLQTFIEHMSNDEPSWRSGEPLWRLIRTYLTTEYKKNEISDSQVFQAFELRFVTRNKTTSLTNQDISNGTNVEAVANAWKVLWGRSSTVELDTVYSIEEKLPAYYSARDDSNKRIVRLAPPEYLTGEDAKYLKGLKMARSIRVYDRQGNEKYVLPSRYAIPKPRYQSGTDFGLYTFPVYPALGDRIAVVSWQSSTYVVGLHLDYSVNNRKNAGFAFFDLMLHLWNTTTGEMTSCPIMLYQRLTVPNMSQNLSPAWSYEAPGTSIVSLTASRRMIVVSLVDRIMVVPLRADGRRLQLVADNVIKIELRSVIEGLRPFPPGIQASTELPRDLLNMLREQCERNSVTLERHIVNGKPTYGDIWKDEFGRFPWLKRVALVAIDPVEGTRFVMQVSLTDGFASRKCSNVMNTLAFFVDLASDKVSIFDLCAFEPLFASPYMTLEEMQNHKDTLTKKPRAKTIASIKRIDDMIRYTWRLSPQINGGDMLLTQGSTLTTTVAFSDTINTTDASNVVRVLTFSSMWAAVAIWAVQGHAISNITRFKLFHERRNFVHTILPKEDFDKELLRRLVWIVLRNGRPIILSTQLVSNTRQLMTSWLCRRFPFLDNLTFSAQVPDLDADQIACFDAAYVSPSIPAMSSKKVYFLVPKSAASTK